MHQVLEILRHLPTLGINPLAAVIVVALVCAIAEQRWRRRRAPDFSGVTHDVYGRPQGPK